MKALDKLAPVALTCNFTPTAAMNGHLLAKLNSAIAMYDTVSLEYGKLLTLAARRDLLDSEERMMAMLGRQQSYFLGGISACAQALFLLQGLDLDTMQSITAYCREHGLD
jgi:hypothetical protein